MLTFKNGFSNDFKTLQRKLKVLYPSSFIYHWNKCQLFYKERKKEVGQVAIGILVLKRGFQMPCFLTACACCLGFGYFWPQIFFFLMTLIGNGFESPKGKFSPRAMFQRSAHSFINGHSNTLTEAQTSGLALPFF